MTSPISTLESMYAERLPSGQWGVYKDNGQRIAVKYKKDLALKHIKKLRERHAPE